MRPKHFWGFCLKPRRRCGAPQGPPGGPILKPEGRSSDGFFVTPLAFQFLKRLLILLATLLLVSGVIFLVLQVIPGDPAQIILGIQATPENLQELRHKLGLDLPQAVQYGNWMGGVLRGDLGRSITYDIPISELILSRLAIFPGLALAWAVLGFNLLGDGLRDLLDPKVTRAKQ